MGKSTLLQHFKAQLGNRARAIMAHRQVWLDSNSLQLTAANRANQESNLLSQEAQGTGRTRDTTSTYRNQVMFYDLIDLTSRLHEDLYNAFRAGDHPLAEKISKKQSPFQLISSILRSSNLPIEITAKSGELLASKAGSDPFGISELSDGERNALLLASYAITLPPDAVMLLDEPERHLHRSIAAPLISKVLEIRPDCAFVVATHEIALPVDNSASRVIQIEAYLPNPSRWDFDEITPENPVREDIATSILGMRRKLLVVEGISSSLDLQIYRALFPNVSVISKETSTEVKNTVIGVNQSADHHRCVAIGVVDGDGMDEGLANSLQERQVYPLEFYSVEYLYYCREVFDWVLLNHAQHHGIDIATAQLAYQGHILAAMAGNRERMVARACEYAARREALTGMPTWNEIAGKGVWSRSVDLGTMFEQEAERFDNAVAAQDTEFFLSRFPFRETDLRNLIAKACGLTDRRKYESLVVSLTTYHGQLADLIRSKLGKVPGALI